MSANQGSLRIGKSFLLEKLSLIGNSLDDAFGILERWSIWTSREIIYNNIFYTIFVSNLEIKLLKKKDPTNKVGFSILLKH